MSDTITTTDRAPAPKPDHTLSHETGKPTARSPIARAFRHRAIPDDPVAPSVHRKPSRQLCTEKPAPAYEIIIDPSYLPAAYATHRDHIQCVVNLVLLFTIASFGIVYFF